MGSLAVAILISAASADCLQFSVQLIEDGVCSPGYVVGWAVSDSGVVAGEFECSFMTATKPACWIDGQFIQIPVPAQYPDGEANDANAAGVVVGTMYNLDDLVTGPWRAFQFVNGSVTILPLPPGHNVSKALGVNNNDPPITVGFSYNDTSGPIHANYWFGQGEPVSLVFPRTHSAMAFDVNEIGSICGYGSPGTPNAFYAFLWEDGVVTPLPNPPEGWYSQGRRLNNKNEVCGHTRLSTATKPRRAVLWSGGQAINLGLLPNTAGDSYATDINDDGVVVGYCTGGTPKSSYAFLWMDGVMHALDDLVDPALGYHFSQAHGINQSGQILAQGGPPGGIHLLTPIPPIPGDLTCDWIVDGEDLGLLLGAWGNCPPAPRPRGRDDSPAPPSCDADLNDDGTVDGADLGLLLGNWTS